MGLLDAYRRIERSRAAAGGGQFTLADAAYGPQVQSQPGNPDFSISRFPSSRAQYPGAAAEQRLFENQRRAQNFVLDQRMAGMDTSSPDYEYANEVAEEGFAQRALTLGESLIGWIDGPRQAVNLMFQDLFGGDAEEGKRNPNIGDYFNALWGGVEDEEGFELATGLNPLSGSKTLDMFGYEEAEGFGGRVGRGITHFLFDVAIDPLTYVTFGLAGLGKKVAAATGKKLSDDVAGWIMPRLQAGTLDDAARALPEGSYLREVASTLDPIRQDFLHKLESMSVKEGGQLTDDTVKKMRAQLTQAGTFDDGITELAIRERVGRDVLKPLVSRDFAAIPENALELLPKYAHGGARISVPFTRGRMSSFFDEAGKPIRQSGTLQSGFVIPGTRGLGRKITDPIRETSNKLRGHGGSPKYKSLADVLESASNAMDVDRGILRALKDGTIAPWQYHIVSSFADVLSNLRHREEIATRMNAHFRDIDTLVENSDITADEVFANVMDRVEGANPSDEALNMFHSIFGQERPVVSSRVNDSPELSAKADEIARDMFDVFDSHLEVLKSMDPRLKKNLFESRAPHLISEDGGQMLAAIYRADGGVPATNPGRQLLSIILEGVAAGGRLEDKVGGSKTVRAMMDDDASSMAAVTLLDDGLVFLKNDKVQEISNLVRRTIEGMDPEDGALVDAGAVSNGRLPLTELNKLLEPEVRAIAEERNIPLPKNWDGKLFNENPLDITLAFVEDTQRAIQGWSMVNALKMVGLAVEHKAGLDVQDIMLTLHERIVANSEKVLPSSGPGIPTAGQKMTPVSWLENAADGGLNIRHDPAHADFARLSDEGKRVSREDFEANISKRGIKQPLIVEVANDGTVMVDDGNHRLAAAKNLGVEEVPTLYRRVDTNSFNMQTGGGPRVGRMLKDELPEYGETVTADKMFKVNPWMPEALDNTKTRLKGTATLKSVTPARIGRKLTLAGLQTGGRKTTDVRELYNMVRTMTRQDFLDLRPPSGQKASYLWDGFVNEIPRALLKGKPGWDNVTGRRIYYDSNGDAKMIFGANPSSTRRDPFDMLWASAPDMTTAELRKALDSATNMLDEEFTTGSMKGLLSHENIMKMMEHGSVSDHGARALYTYLRRKMSSLDDEVKEWLDPQAGEFVDSQMLFDSFTDQMDEMFDAYRSAIRFGDDGEVIFDTSNLNLIGDSEFAGRIAALKETAGMLSEKGHEVAARVMRGLDERVIPAQSLKGFVDPQLFNLGGPALKNLEVQQQMADWMRQLVANSSTIYTPAGVGAFKHAVNDGLRWWRAMATIARPSFHIRNMLGAMWNNMIVGVGPEDYKMVSTNAMKIRKLMKNERLPLEDAIARLDPEVQPYFQAAWEQNVLSGFSTTEFRKLTTDEKRSRMAWAKVWDIDDFALTRMGAHFMESIEDFARMSAFVRWYDPLDPNTAKVAKEMVEAVHFNYTNLTPFETSVKKFVPFFVWQRRNLPLQISQMIENPRMIQRYQHMMDAISYNFGGNEEGLPPGDNFSAFAAGTDMYVNEGTPFWARIMIDPDVPVRDLVDMPWPTPPGLIDFAKNLTGPHISTLVDINTEREWGDVNAPAPFNVVARSLAAAGLYDVTREGDVRIPYWQRTVMETAIPFMKETVDPLTGGSTDPNRQQRQGITADDNHFEAGAKSLMATLASGLGVKMNTPADVRGSAARQREELDRLIREMRLAGQAVPSND